MNRELREWHAADEAEKKSSGREHAPETEVQRALRELYALRDEQKSKTPTAKSTQRTARHAVGVNLVAEQAGTGKGKQVAQPAPRRPSKACCGPYRDGERDMYYSEEMCMPPDNRWEYPDLENCPDCDRGFWRPKKKAERADYLAKLHIELQKEDADGYEGPTDAPRYAPKHLARAVSNRHP